MKKIIPILFGLLTHCSTTPAPVFYKIVTLENTTYIAKQNHDGTFALIQEIP